MEKFSMKNGEELHYFLAMNGVSEDMASCEGLLATMPECEKIDDDYTVAKLHKRWGAGNVRVCLLHAGSVNDWVVRDGRRCKDDVPVNVVVAAPDDRIYDYLDEGMRFLAGVRWYRERLTALPDFDDECMRILREHYDDSEFRRELPDEDELPVLSKASLKKALAKYERRNVEAAEQRRRAEEFERQFKEGRLEVGNLRMDGDTFYVGDQRFGVVGVPVCEVYNHSGDLRAAGDGEDVGSHIAEFLTSYMANLWKGISGSGDRWDYRHLDEVIKYPAQMWVGSFPITVDKRRSEKSSAVLVEGIQVKKSLVSTILQNAQRFDDRGLFVEYVKELRRTPPDAMGLLTDGCHVKLEMGGDLLFSVVREGKRWHLVAGDLRIYVEGGYRNILSLDEREGGFGHWELFQRLSKFVSDKGKILEIVRRARDAYLLVEKRAAQLYEEIKRRCGDRVREAAWDGRNGVVVLGEGGKQYFVEASDKCGVYEYPSGHYVCVVDKGDVGRHLPTHDRIVSKILMLLNDKKLAEQVSTLRQ